MASIHRKSQDGTWYIRYWQEGRQKHRSLGTSSRRCALRLKREMEITLEENGHAELVVSDNLKPTHKNPKVEEFWEAFDRWAQVHRAPSTVEEYKNWFNQFHRFTGMRHLGDATPGPPCYARPLTARDRWLARLREV